MQKIYKEFQMMFSKLLSYFLVRSCELLLNGNLSCMILSGLP